MITEDHINLLPDNPLRGLGAEFGNHFVDMSEPYDPKLREHLENAFLAGDISKNRRICFGDGTAFGNKS